MRCSLGESALFMSAPDPPDGSLKGLTPHSPDLLASPGERARVKPPGPASIPDRSCFLLKQDACQAGRNFLTFPKCLFLQGFRRDSG